MRRLLLALVVVAAGLVDTQSAQDVTAFRAFQLEFDGEPLGRYAQRVTFPVEG